MSVNYVSYWETAYGHAMPPWVALALVSIRRALGDRFTLLTRGSLETLIDPLVASKAWGFEPLAFVMDKGIEAIVAKSDFVRMAYVHRHGGAWIDADSLLLRDPTAVLFPNGLGRGLHWHSECLFAARPGNPLLAQALAAGLAADCHAWGNPGGIKEIVASNPAGQVPISPSVFDPGFRPLYNFDSCAVMRRTDVAVEDFLHRDVAVLKLYNTWFKRTASSHQSVAEFLDDRTLLARLFLAIEPDRGYWLGETARLIEDCG